MTECLSPLCVFFFTTVADLFEISFDFLSVSEKAVIKVPNVCIFGWIIILGCLMACLNSSKVWLELCNYCLPFILFYVVLLSEQLNEHAEL